MHFHKPKPLHGWREFVGEVGIIVLGVLIALGAEQVVETLHWQKEVREFREAVDHELAMNLGTFEYNQLQQKCALARLDELQTILERSRNGETVQLVPGATISGPSNLSQYRSVWDNKDSQVVAHLPMDIRLKYAELYDEFKNTESEKEMQTETWAKFIPFEEPGPLTLGDRRELYAGIHQARGLIAAMDANWPVSQKLGAELGIKPELTAELAAALPRRSFCKPILKH